MARDEDRVAGDEDQTSVVVLEGVRLPALEIGRPLYHRGWIDRRRRKYRATFEGEGLSITTEPAAWDRIARGLISGPLWEMTRPGHRFIDMRAAERSGVLRRLGRKVGVARGLLRPKRLWVHTYFDEESEDTRYTLHTTQASAVADRDDCECGTVKPAEILVPTAKLRRQFPRVDTNETNGLERLVEYLLALDPVADGLWWDDLLDPDAYSAPRGEILPHALPGWRRAAIR